MSGAAGPNEDPSRRVGPYRLLKLLGEGGMGSVWLAQQEQPIRRQVALKLIKPGMDSHEVIARFESERQALARLNHPNVAAVYDAGTTPQDRPYFAMEYVPGMPITTFCDSRRLSIRQRLELLMVVCDAVQHAHQKGIIHRDLKPSNILVAVPESGGETAGRYLPKVIDFGLAKAMAPGESVAVTEHRQFVGTLPYASPEQVDLSQDVDTRADVYALGALLYELLTGLPLFDPHTLRQVGFAELLRVIRQVDPPTPSLRLSGLRAACSPSSASLPVARTTAVGVPHDAAPNEAGRTVTGPLPELQRWMAPEAPTLAQVADLRRTDPRGLHRALRGDLDWITMRALEKDRARRYATASELAADLERHLRGQPVSVGPPTVRYRVEKFVRRNYAAVWAGGLVAGALVVGAAGLIGGLIRAQTEMREATRQTEIAEAASGFLERMFSAATLGQSGLDVRVLDVVDVTRRELEQRPPADLDVEIRARWTLAESYLALGELDAAVEMLDETLDRIEQQRGRADPAYAMTRINLAGALIQQSGLTLSADVVAECRGMIAEAIQVLAPEQDRYWREIATGWLNVVDTYSTSDAAALTEAEAALQRADALITAHALSNDRICGNRLAQAAVIAYLRNDLPHAASDLEQAYAVLQAAVGPFHRETMATMHNLASIYDASGRSQDAAALYKEHLARARSQLKTDHPDLASVLDTLGNRLVDAGHDLDTAAEYLKECAEIRERKLGLEHPDTWRARRCVLYPLGATGHWAEVVRLGQPTYEWFEGRGDLEGARLTLNILCAAYRELRDGSAQAEAHTRRFVELEQARPGALDRRDFYVALNWLAMNLSYQHRYADAAALLDEWMPTLRAHLPNDHEFLINFDRLYASALRLSGRCADGESHLLAAVERWRAARPADPSYAVAVATDLVSLYRAWEDAEPGQHHDQLDTWQVWLVVHQTPE